MSDSDEFLLNLNLAEEEREDQRKTENLAELGSQWNKSKFLLHIIWFFYFINTNSFLT
jgi:hypothetical protein